MQDNDYIIIFNNLKKDIMRKSLLDTLHDYVDITLREDLNFREKYRYPIYYPDDYLIFFPKIEMDQSEDLKDILVSSPEIVAQVKQVFKDFIDTNVNVTDRINLILNDEGFGVKFTRGAELNLDTYAGVISRMDTVQEIDNFCRSTRELITVCRNKELWRNLIKKVYPFAYKHEYNYERLYKGYLIYNKYRAPKSFRISPVKTITEFDKMDEIVKFMFKEGLINESDYICFLELAVQVGNKELINVIYNYYASTDSFEDVQDTLLKFLTSSVGEDEVKIVTNFFKLVYPILKVGIPDKEFKDYMIKSVAKEIRSKEMHELVVNEFDFREYSGWRMFNERVIDATLYFIKRSHERSIELLRAIFESGVFSPIYVVNMTMNKVPNFYSKFTAQEIINLMKTYLDAVAIKEVDEYIFEIEHRSR